MNYAKELAKRGVNVVLMSNEEEQLHEVSKEIGKYLILEPLFQDRAALYFWYNIISIFKEICNLTGYMFLSYHFRNIF
jgi:NADP-dependent 3-hydroxy acid dehydrogenase YdfG